MSKGKHRRQTEEARQLHELLRQYGMSGKSLPLSAKQRRKLDELFPE